MKNYVLTILYFFSFCLFIEPLLATPSLYSDLQGRLSAKAASDRLDPDDVEPFYQPKHFYQPETLNAAEIQLQKDCAKKLVKTLTFIPDKIGVLEKAVNSLSAAVARGDDETMIMHCLCVTAIIYLNNLFECNIADDKNIGPRRKILQDQLKLYKGNPPPGLVIYSNGLLDGYKEQFHKAKDLVRRIEHALNNAPKGVMENVKAQVVDFVKNYRYNAYQKEKWGKVLKSETPFPTHVIWDRIDYWNRKEIFRTPSEASKPAELANNTQVVSDWETKVDLNDLATYDWLRIFREITAERLGCLPEFFHMEPDPKTGKPENGWGSNYSLHQFSDDFSDHSSETQGEPWKTSEHYFQAHKFEEGSPTFLAVFREKKPGDAKRLATYATREIQATATTPYKPPSLDMIKQGWHDPTQMFVDPECLFDPGAYNDQLKNLTYKDCVMVRALYLKFSQNPGIKQLLINTGPRALIENTSKAYPASYPDGHWGNDINDNVANGRPKNILGLMLAALRQYFLIKNGQDLQAFIKELSA